MTSKETVAVVITDAVQKHMKQRLDASPSEGFTIFRVPAWMRKRNKECYEPQMVSIGPYHRGKKHLQQMEEHKWRYLRDFLSRSPKNGWEVYFKEMKVMEQHVRSHYAERVNLSSDKFAEMLLLDSCFILEFVHKLMSHREDNFCIPDGIMRHIIWNDLFLLENQIPFFVLERLFNLHRDSYNSSADGSLSQTLEKSERKILIRRLSMLLQSPKGPFAATNCESLDHLVHLSHCCFVWTPQLASSPKDGCLSVHLIRRRLRLKTFISFFFSCLSCFSRRSTSEFSFKIPSAAELQESGVTIKKKQCDNFLDITFNLEDGVLEIPSILIEHNKKYKLTNLVAFEQTKRMEERYLSSYVTFMQCLISTPKDAAVLQQRGIFQNALSNEEALARFFSDLGDFIVLDPNNNYLSKLFKDMRGYCESNWQKDRTIFIRYQRIILLLVAVVILLPITITLTTFLASPCYYRLHY